MVRDVKVMGIVNVNDDSYYANSRAKEQSSFISRMDLLISQGSDIIDIGACSTRPGAQIIDSQCEWERLEPMLKIVSSNYCKASISIDTFRAEIVERAYDLIGNFIVNDISAGFDDSKMLSTVAKLELPYIAMHKRGSPSDMQNKTQYDSVCDDIFTFFKDFNTKAEDAGIKDYIIDPGFGFAKTIEQNYELLANLEQFKSLGKKILVGISRKSMIYKELNISIEDSLPATSALNLYAIEHGADILRVHDVKQAKECVQIFDRISYFCHH